MTSKVQNDRCIDCRYWQFIDLGRIHTKAGVCKKSPPTAVPFLHDDEADRMRHGRAFWARTLEHDWCGEFKRNT